MAKKAVGRIGRELLSVPVTETGGRVLPKTRQTAKEVSAQRILSRSILVDFNTTHVTVSPYTRDELYRLINSFGYKWDGEHWSRHYPEWVKVEV